MVRRLKYITCTLVWKREGCRGVLFQSSATDMIQTIELDSSQRYTEKGQEGMLPNCSKANFH